ncbi:hypothetical protein LQZ19_06575 [Treponema primitia]
MTQDLITIAERKAAKRAKKKGLRYEVRINENIVNGTISTNINITKN